MLLFLPGIPVFAGEKGICEAGVTALSISYYNLGYQTGEMAYKILKEGADPRKNGYRDRQKSDKTLQQRKLRHFRN